MRCIGLLFSRLRWLIERAGMGRQDLTIATESRHGPELILRYLDAAWADCVVSVDSGAAHFLCAARL